MTAPRPLGYWLTTVDRLLHQRIESAAEATGVSRAGWHLLVRLHSGAVAEDAVDTLPVAGGDGDVRSELSRLAREGLVENQGPEWRLTAEGHSRVTEVQGRTDEEIREGLGSVLTGAQYEELVATLERVAMELDTGLR